MIHTHYKVLPQIFDIAMGEVRGDIFYRHNGFGSELGSGAPMLHLVCRRKAPPLGRPRKAQRRDGAPPVSAYAIAADGRWWSVRYVSPSKARARSITEPPYAKLGRGHWGRIPQMAAVAAALLAAETESFWIRREAAEIRERTGCTLI